jgi:hypothetical protein
MLLPTLFPPPKDNFQVSGMYRFSLVDPVFNISMSFTDDIFGGH